MYPLGMYSKSMPEQCDECVPEVCRKLYPKLTLEKFAREACTRRVYPETIPEICYVYPKHIEIC